MRSQCRYGKTTCMYFDPIKSKRAGKYERLLKALLSSERIMRAINLPESVTEISQSSFKQLIAIKERMEKKGKK